MKPKGRLLWVGLKVGFPLLMGLGLSVGFTEIGAIAASQTTEFSNHGVSSHTASNLIALSTKVPGTAVSITPPAGFKASQLFTGFEQTESGASIVVTEMPVPAQAQAKLLEQLSSVQVLKPRGIALISSQAVTVEGQPGQLLLVSQKLQGITFLKWVLVLAKGDRLLIVNAPFPASTASKLREPLRQSLLGLQWQPTLQNTLLEGLPFTIQEQGDLKVAGRMSNTIILTQNGMQPPVPDSAPILVVGSAYQKTYIGDVAQFAQQRLKQTTQVRDLVVSSSKTKAIAEQRGFEIVAQGYDVKTNTPLTLYQVIIATQQTYYIIQGLVPKTEASKYLPVFRTIAESFKPRI